MPEPTRSTISLHALNQMARDDFVSICGPLFEHSPWIAERTWASRPFGTLEQLHQALCGTMFAATTDKKVRVITSHPDLVGRMVREGKLTRESTAEQKSAGLDALSEDEIQQFDRLNTAYGEKFGFPFVICARENKKHAILAAFPVRLNNTREEEIKTALQEIAKIAKLRLLDAVKDG